MMAQYLYNNLFSHLPNTYAIDVSIVCAVQAIDGIGSSPTFCAHYIVFLCALCCLRHRYIYPFTIISHWLIVVRL